MRPKGPTVDRHAAAEPMAQGHHGPKPHRIRAQLSRAGDALPAQGVVALIPGKRIIHYSLAAELDDTQPPG